MDAARCESTSDCIFLTGSAFQRRIHGVYLLTTLTCSGKPVYRGKGEPELAPNPQHKGARGRNLTYMGLATEIQVRPYPGSVSPPQWGRGSHPQGGGGERVPFATGQPRRGPRGARGEIGFAIAALTHVRRGRPPLKPPAPAPPPPPVPPPPPPPPPMQPICLPQATLAGRCALPALPRPRAAMEHRAGATHALPCRARWGGRACPRPP
eukprot:scaffold11993_cov84-Isochrysis_galbana.AAC.2